MNAAVTKPMSVTQAVPDWSMSSVHVLVTTERKHTDTVIMSNGGRGRISMSE